jgi:hypothetical protein
LYIRNKEKLGMHPSKPGGGKTFPEEWFYLVTSRCNVKLVVSEQKWLSLKCDSFRKFLTRLWAGQSGF